MTFQITKGCLFYTGTIIDLLANKWIKLYDNEIMNKYLDIRLQRDGPNYHITVINKADMKNFDINLEDLNKMNIKFYDFGIGSIETIFK